HAGLAEQAPAMVWPHAGDPRYYYLAGVCHLAAHNYPAVLVACQRVQRLCGKDGAGLAVESDYLAGRAHALQENAQSASAALRRVAQAADSPSAAHARGLLGKLAFAAGETLDAIGWWQGLDVKKRQAWKLSETLAGAVFLTSLEAYEAGDYERA